MIVLLLSSIFLGGCVTYSQKKSLATGQVVKPKLEKTEIIPIPKKLPCQRLYQDEIIHLKQMIAEKDELIQHLTVLELEKDELIQYLIERGLDQAQALQETASEISRAKNKLHRLATQPEAASKIAEVEVAMATLKRTELSKPDEIFRSLAQELLGAAMVAYAQKNYSSVMNYAAQSYELIGAIISSPRKSSGLRDIPLSFSTPISLLVTQNSQLRLDPNSDSRIIGPLKKSTSLVATAYRGDWFYVQTTDSLSGWVKNSVVDVQVNNRNYEKQTSLN
jgi:hypothetical protein